MNEFQYRSDERKYLKTISKAMGKNACICGKAVVLRDPRDPIFDPEFNAEQRWELLKWIHNRLDKGIEGTEKANEIDNLLYMMWKEENPPLALILATLDLIQEIDVSCSRRT